MHSDWVTADLEQEATRKGSGTSKRGARVVSSISWARAARRRFSESTATLRSETLGLIPSRAESLPAQSGRCQYSRRLGKLSYSPPVATPSPSPTDTDSESIIMMVVRYACMACQTSSGCSAHSSSPLPGPGRAGPGRAAVTNGLYVYHLSMTTSYLQ